MVTWWVRGYFLSGGRVVSIVSYHSQVRFSLRLVYWRMVLLGRTGWGGVAAKFFSLCSLGFSSGKICMYLGMGSYFCDSHKEIVRLLSYSKH